MAPPRLAYDTTTGLTGVLATLGVSDYGGVVTVDVLAAGTGLTAATASASVVGGGGTGAVVQINPAFSVSGVSVASSGSGYYAAPVLTFRPAASDPNGRGASATVSVNTAGQVTDVSVVSGGAYSAPPTAVILDSSAVAQATVAAAIRGKYHCAIRYLDDTPATNRGPIPSSISEIVTVTVPSDAASLTWTLTHHSLDDRVKAVELWRSSADQAVSLYRVATIYRSDANFSGQYVDSLTDPDLQDSTRGGFAVLPIVLPSGQLNARRFGVPPGDLAVAVMFQDRAWMAVDTTGERPNTLMFSEVDEPESVPPENELILQENIGEPDAIVHLMPLGTQLLVIQSRHLYALTYVAQPVIDASMLLMAYRGILNSRCGDVMGGVAFLADTYGVYAYDGNNAQAISLPVDNYWRDNIIDFSQADKFHVRCDPATATMRFFYCRHTDSATVRALCYCSNTQAWWEETYGTPVTAGCRSAIGNRAVLVSGCGDGVFRKYGGLRDDNTPIDYKFRSGNFSLINEKSDRSISLVYKPTHNTATLNMALHFNNSSTPRPNAVATDTGSGFVTTEGQTAAALELRATRSALGDANGYAKARYSGRIDDRSSGGDRHMAVDVSGQQTQDPVTIYGVQIAGVQ